MMMTFLEKKMTSLFFSISGSTRGSGRSKDKKLLGLFPFSEVFITCFLLFGGFEGKQKIYICPPCEPVPE